MYIHKKKKLQVEPFFLNFGASPFESFPTRGFPSTDSKGRGKLLGEFLRSSAFLLTRNKFVSIWGIFFLLGKLGLGVAHPGLRRVSPEVEGIFEGNFRRFDLFGFLGLKEGLDEQARLDPFFGGFFGLGEVFAVGREVEGVV